MADKREIVMIMLLNELDLNDEKQTRVQKQDSGYRDYKKMDKLFCAAQTLSLCYKCSVVKLLCFL